jgi:hypothetical protein
MVAVPFDAGSRAAELYPLVWRTTLGPPGFALLRLDRRTDSRALRHAMAALLEGFGDAAEAGGGERFVAERLGRFDQQVTTRFHRDGAPAASLLLLGYEPSPIRSRFFVADACRAAHDAGLEVEAFLSAHNPMFPTGEQRLAPYVTEIELPRDECFILAINNSLLPYIPGGQNPLGLLHKGTITNPDPTARRVINSLGAMPISGAPERRKTAQQLEEFLTRDDLD